MSVPNINEQGWISWIGEKACNTATYAKETASNLYYGNQESPKPDSELKIDDFTLTEDDKPKVTITCSSLSLPIAFSLNFESRT